jgi:hypothetical protein
VKFPVRWAVVAGVAALGAALTVWFLREPSGAMVVPPLHPPRLKAANDPGKAAEAPENEAVTEDAPTMPVGTVDLPEQLDRRQLEAGMAKVKELVERCRGLETFVGTITVKLTIARSGNVQSVVLVSPLLRTATTDCVTKAARNASFPRFRGTLLPTIELTYPFLFPGPGS